MGISGKQSFTLLYGRGRYYTSSERVNNLWIKTPKEAETSDKSIAYAFFFQIM